VDPEKAAADAKKRDRAIDKNYQAALDIYQDMDRPERGITGLDRRIQNNERLVADYHRRIGAAQEQRRQQQVELFNRTFFLRQQRERGQITQEVFDKLIRQEERKYEEDTANLKASLEAWQRECSQAEARLDSLKAERRMLQASTARPALRGRQAQQQGGPVPAPKPGERLLGSLQERLRQLDHFDTHDTLDGVHPRDIGVGTVEGGAGGSGD
jgi:hypothetical protein